MAGRAVTHVLATRDLGVLQEAVVIGVETCRDAVAPIEAMQASGLGIDANQRDSAARLYDREIRNGSTVRRGVAIVIAADERGDRQQCGERASPRRLTSG